jgi:circadian clock protein KaiC
MHLVAMHDLVSEFKPHVVVLDPITDFTIVGDQNEIKSAITRTIDFLKSNQITALFVSIISEDEVTGRSTVGISSLIDTWISVRNMERDGEYHRGIFVLKSRGMSHSNQIRSFLISDDGIKIGAMDHPGS